MTTPVYISNGGDALGPYEISQLRSMWSTGQITANTLYWDEVRQEWHGISELGLGDSAATATEAKPKGKFLDGVGSSSKHTSPVRYWALRGGGLGLAGGFLTGIAGYGAPPAMALGMGIPIGLLFAGIGAIIGLAIKMTRREAKK
jgi:hypothetical protein